MDPGFLMNGVLRSVMGGRAKTSRKALRYLTGSRGSLMSNPATLLTAAGLAWGVFETLQSRQGQPGATGQWGGGVQGAPGTGLESPSPSGAPASVSPGPPPPLPDPPGTATAADEDAMRLVRLAISAAHADGTITDRERAAVLKQATEAGVAEVVERELQQPTPLAAIVAGMTDPAGRATLYVLAYTILRADEQVTGAERIYLAQLGHLLALDPQTVQQLEKDAGERIEALGDQGQLGG